MKRMLILGAAALGLALTSLSVSARAQDGRFYDPMSEAPPVVVRKHLPFTDSGTVVPLGYEHRYMVDQTTANLPVYSSYRPDAFGQSVLPGRFGEIGRGGY